MLCSLGHQAEIGAEVPDSFTDTPDSSLNSSPVSIFFNAYKSSSKIRRLVESDRKQEVTIATVISGSNPNDSKFQRPDTQFAIRSSDILIAYEDSTFELLSSDGHQNVVLIPHSCQPTEETNFSFDDGVHVVSVSHMRPRKNLLNYFRCIKQHFSERKDLFFHHVGGVHDLEYSNTIASISDQIPNLKLYGAKSRLDTIEIVKATDLLVHPSTLEGYPNVVAEAITNSTPVLLSRIPAHTANLAKWQPGFDYFFDIACGIELVNLLESFLDDSQFKTELEEACSRIKPHFSSELEIAGLKKLVKTISAV